jgi:hypothetical protein
VPLSNLGSYATFFHDIIYLEVIMSKYDPLWKYVKENNKDEYKLSFEEVKKIVGFEFDHAFLTFKKELLDYGYEFKKLSLKEKWVMIVKK